MEATKLETIQQPLLKRAVVTYRVAYDGATPSRVQLVQSISSKEKGTVVVTHVYTQQGQQTAIVHAHVYSDTKVSGAVERANLIAKQHPKAEAAETA
jgi:ribosomal protein S24E